MHGVVFDIETTANPEIVARLGIDTKLAEIENLDAEQLRHVADREGINIPDRWKKRDPIYNKCVQHYSAQRDKAALASFSNMICTIAARDVAGADEDVRTIKAGEKPAKSWDGWVMSITEERSETTVIKGFFSYLESFGDAMLMGFNIRGRGGWKTGFDIPVLRVRCSILGIPWPSWMPSTLSMDMRSDRLFDCCDVYTEGSCDDWLRAHGLPLKTAGGAAVADMTPKQRSAYCANDVELERLLLGTLLPFQHPRLQDLL